MVSSRAEAGVKPEVKHPRLYVRVDVKYWVKDVNVNMVGVPKNGDTQPNTVLSAESSISHPSDKVHGAEKYL